MKGNVTAIPLILVAVLSVTIAVLVSHLILSEVISATDDDQIDQGTLNKAQSALGVFDLGIVAVNAFFYIASFVFVYRIKSNPIFMIPSFLFLGISVWFSSEIANIYSLFANTSVITASANAFPTLNLFYNNLAAITAVLGLGILVMLYGKTRSGQEVQI